RARRRGRRPERAERLAVPGLDGAGAGQLPLSRGEGRCGDRAVLPAVGPHLVPRGTASLTRGPAMAQPSSSPCPAQPDVARCVAAVVRARRSVRAFAPRPLPRELVQAILEDAGTAPSGGNIQPWRVYVVTGAAKAALSDAVVAAFRAEDAPAPAHFPDP